MDLLRTTPRKVVQLFLLVCMFWGATQQKRLARLKIIHSQSYATEATTLWSKILEEKQMLKIC